MTNNSVNDKSESPPGQTNGSISFLFIIAYIALIIFAFLPKQYPAIYIPWQLFNISQILSLCAGVGLCCFVPGYAIICTIDRKNQLERLPRGLLAYIFSILVTGMTGYIAGSEGLALSHINTIIALVNVLILAQFLYIKFLREFRFRYNLFSIFRLGNNLMQTDTIAQFIVFSSLFALVILFTLILYDGTIIGDELDHYGRAIIFLSGMFKQYAISGMLSPYPPFFFSFLATLFSISNVPSVNAYVSIGFLNILPVIAFYYFFTRWIPNHKRAALLASTLFMLSSGFGWAYVLSLGSQNPVISHQAAMNNLFVASVKTFDVWTPNTFINVAHPDITTPLIIIALPSGFVLLGVLKENLSSRFRQISITAGISILGILSHEEFGLFLIVASVLPLIFRLRNKSVIFVGILIALSLVTFISAYPTGADYKQRSVLGVPLLALYFGFITSMWILYLGDFTGKLHKPQFFQTIENIFSRKRLRFILGIVIISAVAYFYILSFVIWNVERPVNDVRLYTNKLHFVPLYFYPLRFGLTGLLGLAFILSHIFNRYEKEVFVFGIIALVAFLAGPYYDEQRFSKYIMAGMAAFASLLLYKILSIKFGNIKKPLINGILIGITITSSSLSVLMYEGYSALGVKNINHNFDGLLGGRHFPSQSDLIFLDFLRHHVNLKTDDVAVPENYIAHRFYYQGFGAMLEAFIGLPLSKVSQSPSTLQESTLAGLYYLLNYSNTRLIVLPQQYIREGLSDPLNFVALNFPKIYKDNNYTVFSVPSLTPPASVGNIGLMIRPSIADYNINTSSASIVYYNNKSQANGTSFSGNDGIVRLIGDKVVWLKKPQQKNLNYIEGMFRIDSEKSPDNHGGLLWNSAKRTYYVFLRPNKLSFSDTIRGELASVPIKREDGKWYDLQVVQTNNIINIFLNNILELQVPTPSAKFNITTVGIRAHNSIAEFQPLNIGVASMSKDEYYDQGPVSNNYNFYSLSILALSNLRYDIFDEGDFTAFGKKNLILNFDPLEITNYLDFVKNGGTLTILDTQGDLKGEFSRFLCLRTSNETKFDSIMGSENEPRLGVLGLTRNISIGCHGSTITSFYANNLHAVAPFAIEKGYGKGKVIFVNALGYYTAISSSPMQYFLTLGNITTIMNIIQDHSANNRPYTNAIPTTRFEGDLNMSGDVLVRTSSLVLPNDYTLIANNISFGDQAHVSSINKSDLLDAKIRELKIYGTSNVTAHVGRLSYIPSQSPYSYINLHLIGGSDLEIKLSNTSKAELVVGDNHPLNVTGGRIEFKGIRDGLASSPYVPVLMKRPEFDVKGLLSFQELRSNNPHNPAKPWANAAPVRLQGHSSIRLNYLNNNVDDSTRYITYFDWLSTDSNTDTPIKTSGLTLQVPLVEAMQTSVGIKLGVTVLVIAALSIFLGISRLTSQVKKH